jgi:signal transduction histidine kinase
MNEHPLSVLLVEDYQPHVAMFREMLSKAGVTNWSVDVADRLDGTLKSIAAHAPDVVLLDLQLPDSDGFDTFAAVFAAGDFPIVVLSGMDDEALAVQTVKQGAQDYLVKGRVDHHLLVRTVRYAIERHRIQRELEAARADLERRVEERTAEFKAAIEQLRVEVEQRQKAEAAVRDTNNQLADALMRLRQSQEQTVQRERLHALGRMASGIAHEFNNALSPIIGFSGLLLNKPDLFNDRAKAREYLLMIHNAAQDSARIVSQLRGFYRAKPDGSGFKPVSLNEIAGQVVVLTRPLWKDQAQAEGANIEVQTAFDPRLPEMSGDATALREMLINLMMNAIDAVGKGGTVTIGTTLGEGRIVLTVKDNGVGMNREVCERCVEPFFTTKDEKGTGLGLSIVYGIVQRHGGEIGIQSAPKEGTTITASFPLQSKAAPVESIPAPALMIKPSRILVVEDEPLVRELITVYLGEDKHQVQTADNGRTGLEKFQAGEFDLVLTDRAMPGMNGDQLARMIKEIKPGQPVILLTGFGDLMPGEEKPEGVDDIVGKPFTMQTLRAAIARALTK